MLTGVDRAFRLVFNALAFLGFAIGGALLSWIVLPVIRVRTADEKEAARRSRAVVGWTFRLFHDYMRICRLILYDPRRVVWPTIQGPVVVVANHPTLIDVTALLASRPDMVCIVKGALFHSPAFSHLLRCCGHIVSERDDGLAGAAVIREALANLAEGVSVLIFPEGTRSPEGGMHRWRRGAFEIAARAGCPVLPVYLSCLPPVLAKAAPWYRTPADPAVLLVEPQALVDPVEWGGSSAKMAAEIEERLRRRMLAVGAKGGPRRDEAAASAVRSFTGDIGGNGRSTASRAEYHHASFSDES